jgi:ammonium transporter, Amt family
VLAAHGTAGLVGILFYAFVVTFLLLKLIGLFTPLRATAHQEAVGMDVTQHGEEAYVTGEGAILITPEAGLEGDRPVADPV